MRGQAGGLPRSTRLLHRTSQFGRGAPLAGGGIIGVGSCAGVRVSWERKRGCRRGANRTSRRRRTSVQLGVTERQPGLCSFTCAGDRLSHTQTDTLGAIIENDTDTRAGDAAEALTLKGPSALAVVCSLPLQQRRAHCQQNHLAAPLADLHTPRTLRAAMIDVNALEKCAP